MCNTYGIDGMVPSAITARNSIEHNRIRYGSNGLKGWGSYLILRYDFYDTDLYLLKPSISCTYSTWIKVDAEFLDEAEQKCQYERPEGYIYITQANPNMTLREKFGEPFQWRPLETVFTRINYKGEYVTIEETVKPCVTSWETVARRIVTTSNILYLLDDTKYAYDVCVALELGLDPEKYELNFLGSEESQELWKIALYKEESNV